MSTVGRRFGKFANTMLIKVKMKHLVALLAVAISIICYIYQSKMADKNIQIVRNIAQNISDADKALETIITNDLVFIREYFSTHPKMNAADLIKIKTKINNPTITIYDKKGYFYLTTSRAMDPSYEYYNHYKNLSVLNGKSSSKVLSTIQSCINAHANPDQIFVLPIYTRKAPYTNVTKNAVLYDSKLQKFFDVSHSGKDIDKIIDQNFDLHKNVVYIAISDRHGNLIIEKGDRNFQKHSMEKMEKYSHDVLVTKSISSTVFRTSFGGEKDVTGMTVNGDKSYFYVLTIVFKN